VLDDLQARKRPGSRIGNEISLVDAAHTLEGVEENVTKKTRTAAKSRPLTRQNRLPVINED